MKQIEDSEKKLLHKKRPCKKTKPEFSGRKYGLGDHHKNQLIQINNITLDLIISIV